MPAYKDNASGTWYVKFQIKGKDGQIKQIKRRGFQKKKDAIMWEAETRASYTNSCSMKFSTFVYEKYLPYEEGIIKRVSYITKVSIIDTHIMPFFGDMKIDEIDVQDVIDWHSWLMEKPARNKRGHLSSSSLANIHGQMHHIMKHAMKVLSLQRDVVDIAGTIGHQSKIRNTYWTLEEYKAFDKELVNGKYNPQCHYAFLLMFFCGLRTSETLALLPSDFDFTKKTVSITKNYLRRNGENLVSTPKTESSNRTLGMPDIVADELKKFIEGLYGIGPHERIFTISRYTLRRVLKIAGKAAGIETEVSPHSLRHSMATLLMESGYSLTDVGKRLGHAWYGSTLRYVHTYNSVQDKMVETLNELSKDQTKSS